MNARLQIAALPRSAVAEVLHLRQTPENAAFGGDIAEMVTDDSPDRDFHKLSDGAAVVGFFKIERNYHRAHDFAAPGDFGLRALQIDGQHHGKGYGKALFAALPAYLRRTYPEMSRIWLTVNCRNRAAHHVYLRGGWVDTGTLYLGGSLGPQHIMRLDL